MHLTQLAFNYRKLLFMILFALMCYGVVSYFTLPAREDPQITIRESVVITEYPGLSPERVENLITKKLERAIRKIPEVKEIKSTAMTGQSIIHVKVYDKYKNLKPIWQNLRNKIDEAYAQLPQGTRKSKVNDEYGNVSAITLAVTGDGFELAQLNNFSKNIRDLLYAVEGTSKVEILGVQEERIFLEISNAKLSQVGLSPLEISETLKQQNIIQPGGIVDTGGKSILFEPTGNFNSLKDIGDTLITLPNTELVIPLSDLFEIKRNYIDPPYKTSYFNGKPALILSISMLDGHNVLEYAPRVKQKIKKIEQELPIGINLDIATYQADQVASTVYGVSSSVIQTIFIVLLVVILFLGFKTGLIVGLIVPFVVLVTLAFMNFIDLELERMSLATIIIALGLLIDNAIVIAEDFKRRLEEGESREHALKRCGTELLVPLLISTLTSILVFLPLMLAQHVAGEYTRSISLVILIALSTSWILALCVTPTLCYLFLTVSPEKKSSSSKEVINNAYIKILSWILKNKVIFVSGMIGLLILAIFLLQIVPKQFFPSSNRKQVLVYIELPSSTTSRTTDRRMQDVFQWLNNEKFIEIENYSGYVGYGGPRFVLSLSPEDPAENKGFIVITTKSFESIDDFIEKLRLGFNNNFPDMFVRVTKMFLGPKDSSKLEVEIQGYDADILFTTAEKIKEYFHSIPNTIDIRTDWENRITKVNVKVDQQRARRAGISSEDIARSMQSYLQGMAITEFRDNDDIIPIILRANAGERFNLDRARSLNVFSSSNKNSVPLFQIADFKSKHQYSKIIRKNMFRTITVEVKSLSMTAEDLKNIVDPKIQEFNGAMPLNHKVTYSGVISDSKDAQSALMANVPFVIGLIIVLLVLQFNCYRRTLIIILTIPLILIGAAIGLLATKSYFGFMVTLGLYSLCGIIINNAIVLIDRIDIERDSGKAISQAIIDACVIRLRPITMTTITTIIGLLPLIISKDPLFYGMSNTIAFGLGIGTILTLGLVPALYAILLKNDVKEKKI